MTVNPDGFADKAERRTFLEQIQSAKLPDGTSTRTLLQRLANPAVRGPFLDTLLRQPLPRVEESIDSLTMLGNEQAIPVLTPLLHSLDEPVVLAVIEALQRQAWPGARSALSERVTFDRRPDVRAAAAAALARLPDDIQAPPASTLLPLHSAYLTAVDGAGAQMAIVARRWSGADEEDVDTASFHVILDDVVGIREAFGFPLEASKEFIDILDELEDDGLTPIAVPLEEIRTAVDAAYRLSLSRRGRTSVTFSAWRAMLDGPDLRDIAPVELPNVSLERNFEAFAESDQLLDLDEFGTWYFESDEMSSAIEELDRLQKRRGEEGYERRVAGLIRKTLSRQITPEQSELFRQRLLRQAALLVRLYEDDVHARRALAAAASLAGGASIEPTEHPLLQEMLVRSLEDALGRPIVDQRTSYAE
jgi:hypothetical protein